MISNEMVLLVNINKQILNKMRQYYDYLCLAHNITWVCRAAQIEIIMITIIIMCVSSIQEHI